MSSSSPESWFEGVREGMREYERDRAPLLAGSPSPDLPPIPRYDLRERLGQGATAAVYRAWDRELKRPVALKILSAEAAANETLRSRFRHEGQAMAGLPHPNIVGIYDVGEAERRPYLVMELVEGRPLAEILAGRDYEVRSALLLLEKAAGGVAAAHERGVVHRDLKPSNIIVTRDGAPKVGDFGLAHWMGADTGLTRTGSTIGTPMYMAPEQVGGRADDITPRTDVHALGAMLYEILTGRPPHRGDTVLEVYRKIVHEEPMAPRKLNAKASRELETIAIKALEKDPRRRYATAKQFAEDLRRHREGEPILARPTSRAVKVLKWMRRHPTAVAVAGVAVVSLAVLWAALQRGAAAREEQKRKTIEGLLAEGRRASEDVARLGVGLGRLREEEKALRGTIQSWEGEEEKKPLWDLQRRIEKEAQEVALRRGDLRVAFTSVLGVDPRNPEARAALARSYFEDYEEAEQRKDRRGISVSEEMVRLFDLPAGASAGAGEGAYSSRLKQEGTVALDSNPSGAEVHVFRYEEAFDRRLAPAPYSLERKETRPATEALEFSAFHRLGACPVPGTKFPCGSYLLVLRKEGYRDVRYPVLVRRGGRNDGTVTLYTEEEIGADFIHVPAGRFMRGGDPEAHHPTEPDWDAEAPGVFIAKHETKCEEYLEFLNDREFHSVEQAWLRSPRDSTDGIAGRFYWTRFGSGILMRRDFTGLPMLAVSWEDAHEYCAWRTRKAREKGDRGAYRLPTSLEWEKAARGVDGRSFPWGDHFDFTFAKGGESTREKVRIDPAGRFPKDESPYGVRDMAGGMQEWCEDWANEKNNWKFVRGAGWADNEVIRFRAASWQCQLPQSTNAILGFRLVRVLEGR